MLTYIIQIVLFQILFLAVYDFFLSKETFHKYNRWYLLGTPILSFVLPLIKIPTFQKAMPEEIMIFLPEIMLSPQKVIEQTTFYADGSFDYVSLLFWIGVAIFTIIFLIKLFKIVGLILKNETIKTHFYNLVLLPKHNNAFSFFNYIFLGKEIPTEKKDAIIEHELIHATQKHSIDLLFFELLKIVMWFNPMIYFYQRRITLLHEYISDAAIIKTTEKQTYFNTLLNQTFQVENISFVNQFYKHSFIKKRIIMMTKNKSNQFRKAKYLLLLPLLASMLIYTSCETNDIIEEVPVDQKEKNLNTKQSKKLPASMLKEVVVGDKNGVIEVSTNDKLSSSVRLFVAKNFNAQVSKSLNLSNDNFKIYSVFTVNKKGEIENVRVRAPHPELKKETERVLAILPKLAPIKKDGKIVSMTFTLPISSFVGSVKNNSKNNDPYYVNDVPFAIIENVPVFPGCKGTRKEKSDCLNSSIKKSVITNFNTNLSKGLNLSTGKKKIWIVFRIDEDGNVTEINARAPHPELKKEAIRVASLLPKMIPGKQRGKAVGMKYAFPISFNVE